MDKKSGDTSKITSDTGGITVAEIGLLFVMAIAGGIVALFGFFGMINKRVSEPKRELQKRVEQLEEEVRELKNK